MSIERYNARKAEIHWQQVWDAQSVFAARRDDPRPTYEVPEMFPHPHRRIRPGAELDHVRNCTRGDVVARYKRARGFNVLPPMGCDALQLRSIGLSFLGSRTMATCNPDDWRQRADLAGVEKPFEVDQNDIVDTYGADAVRWFVLSDSPPDRDLVWTDGGIHGAWRFVHRLWRLINAAEKFSLGAATPTTTAFSEPALEVRKTAHRALAQVSGNIERLRFNVGVAHIYAFARALEAVVANSSGAASPDLKFAAREAAEIMVQLFHPMMPHLAEECWAALGHTRLLATQSWPALEADLLVDGAVTLAVHVNGRRRADVTVARDAQNGDIEASVLALDVVLRALDGKTPRKVIIIPQRIINVVA
jgi:leucyl-tRNA synthetase